MNIITRVCALIALLTPLVSYAGQCDGTLGITNPEAFVWTHVPATTGVDAHYTGTLEIAEATLDVGSDWVTTRVYRQQGECDSIPGPTIHMTPGNKYVLQFRNTLPYQEASTEHNVFKDPNVSNLHTHGLHISGESPGDDVTRSFEGTAGGDFVYDIPADHMGGTFWYHAHHHGSTYLQVSGGAFGLIVIDDSADGVPSTVDSMTERQLVIAYLDPDVAGTGGDTLITGTLSPTWTVNGHINGDLSVQQGTWEHFRILLADRDAKPKTVSIGSQCEVALMARDGVWRTEVPLVLDSNSIKITGASRADLAVKCSGPSSISVGSTQVASISINPELDPDSGPSPYGENGVSVWSAIRPTYLRDLRGQPVGNTESINMGARTINGSKYNNDVANFTMSDDSLQRWTLKGARNHPFHLHIYHVQIDGSCADYEDGEYYDVVANNCDILFDLSSDSSTVYGGRTIMHCHILEHEDQGAMGWLDVDGGQDPPTYPAGYYRESYDPIIPGGSVPNAPDGLVATAVSSSQIDLVWNDKSTDEDSFEVEVSSNNADFSSFPSLGANTTSFSDTGLSASSTWYYRVRASNSTGSSAYSDTASATTLSGGTPSSMRADSITVGTVGAGKGFKKARATVIVLDDLGGVVEGVLVEGDFTGEIEGTASAVTGADGSVNIDSTATVKGKVSNLTFCVTSINGPLGDQTQPLVDCDSL